MKDTSGNKKVTDNFYEQPIKNRCFVPQHENCLPGVVTKLYSGNAGNGLRKKALRKFIWKALRKETVVTKACNYF